jgi:hypothetical protein
MVFLVAYDLRSPNDTAQDYERVINRIKDQFDWCHLEQSVWLVEAALNATEIRSVVQPYIHSTDALFVARLQGNWSSWSLGDARNNWLRRQSF